MERNFEFVSLIRPSLEAGIATCRDRARVGVYLPQAFYDIGLFAMFLERPYESLMAYCKAVQMSDTAGNIADPLVQVERFSNALKGRIPEGKSMHLECIRRFLLAPRYAKLFQNARKA